jgi:sulfide:quinone oxidoreductase
MKNPDRAPKTALVLGGGVGGLVAAHRLRARLPRRHRVVIVDREAQHVFQPSLLWVASGERSLERIQRPLAGLRRKGIEVIKGDVERIDAGARTVTVSGQTLTGDAIIVALGAEFAPDAIPGLSDAGHNLYSPSGAAALHGALQTFSGGRVIVLTAAPAYKCPAAPYEAAMLIESVLRQRGVRHGAQLDMYAAEPAPMGVAGPAVSAGVVQLLASKGIAYHPAHQVTSVDVAAKTVTFANGATAGFDLLVYVPPHRAPAAVRESGLTKETGWIPVNRKTFETSVAGVWAIGDVTTVPLSMGRPLPKAGVFAHGQAEVVASNIAAAWLGVGRQREFDGWGKCFIETGDGRAGFGAGNFYGEPAPTVSLHAPSRWGHLGKIWFERWWLWRWL